jgi:uncharacterized membrane protein
MRGVEDAAPYNIKKETTTMPNTHARASILDIAKSIALVNMLAFHAMYDIVYIFGVDAPWFKSLGAFFWQQFICFTFIICSGAVLPLSRKPMRHAATLFGCGCLLTLITYFFMPEEVIHFGILSLLGASAFITALLLPLFKKLPATPAALAFFALFAVTYNVPRHGYPFRFFYWLGFPREGFYSSDYFALIPWLFLYIFGYFAWRAVMESPARAAVMNIPRVKICEWVSRRSLVIYMLHQPMIYGVLLLLFR